MDFAVFQRFDRVWSEFEFVFLLLMAGIEIDQRYYGGSTVRKQRAWTEMDNNETVQRRSILKRRGKTKDVLNSRSKSVAPVCQWDPRGYRWIQSAVTEYFHYLVLVHGSLRTKELWWWFTWLKNGEILLYSNWRIKTSSHLIHSLKLYFLLSLLFLLLLKGFSYSELFPFIEQ